MMRMMIMNDDGYLLHGLGGRELLESGAFEAGLVLWGMIEKIISSHSQHK